MIVTQELGVDPLGMLKPRRKIAGISAILLPFHEDGAIDWASFERHVERTVEAGLTPAVNMDTGYVNFLADDERLAVLDHTRSILGRQSFVAGAFVKDAPGGVFQGDVYRSRIDEIQERGGVPVIFQSFGLVEKRLIFLISFIAFL